MKKPSPFKEGGVGVEGGGEGWGWRVEGGIRSTGTQSRGDAHLYRKTERVAHKKIKKNLYLYRYTVQQRYR